jgi:3-oxoacyl-[acyl-carrier protein] reductase
VSGTEQRTVLVTGASKGIGRAIAVRLAKESFSITIHFGQDAAGAEETLAQVTTLGAQGHTLSFDIADREATRLALEQDLAVHGPYWGVVLNAGITKDNVFPGLSGEDWDAVIQTNLGGFYNVLHPLMLPMIRLRQGGRVVTISSVSGLVGNSGQVNYSASKAGIIGATKALALELATRQITVNCVAPGLIETQMIQGLPVDQILPHIPMRRLGRPEEIAATVAFLFSDDAAYITRQVISVNGGLA